MGYGRIANTDALVLGNKTLESCAGPKPSACTRSENTDYQGHDYAKVPSASADACCAACSTDSICQVAVFYEGGCWKKTSLGAARRSLGRVAVLPRKSVFV